MTQPKLDLTALLAAQTQGRFFGPQPHEAYDKPTNIVVAGNGIFRVVKTPTALFKAKLTDIPAANKIPGLGEMEEGPELLVPKIPLKYLIMALTWYRDVYDQDKTEASILFFWNHDNVALPSHYSPTEAQAKLGLQGDEVKGLIEDGQLVVYCPQQKNSGTLSEFGDDGMVDYLREHCTPLVETHSHHTMDAFFSGTDDANENSTQFYGVWGKIKDEQPKFIFRWVCGGKKVIIDPSVLFEIPQVEIKTTVTRTIPVEGFVPVVTEELKYETFKGPWERIEAPEDWMAQHRKAYTAAYNYTKPKTGGATPSGQGRGAYSYADEYYPYNSAYGYDGYDLGTGHDGYGNHGAGGGLKDKKDYKSNFKSETDVNVKRNSPSLNQDTITAVEIFLEKNLSEEKSIGDVEETVRFIVNELIGLGYDYILSDTIEENPDYGYSGGLGYEIM